MRTTGPGASLVRVDLGTGEENQVLVFNSGDLASPPQDLCVIVTRE